MKANYIKPEVEITEVNFERHLCAGSDLIDNGLDDIEVDGGSALSADHTFDFNVWGDDEEE